jgi:hypothetical protein
MEARLSDELRALADDPRVPLLGYSDPARDQEVPAWVWLRSGCADLAADLHREFGDQVDLRVGLLPFPLSRCSDDAPVAGDVPPAPSWLGVRPVQPVLIGRHRDSVLVPVRLSNRSAHDVVIVIGQTAVGHLLDPQTLQIAGGPAGVTNLMALVHEVPAGGCVEVSAMFGPASARTRWGYQLPAGRWLGCVDFAVRAGSADDTRTEARSLPFPVRIV